MRADEEAPGFMTGRGGSVMNIILLILLILAAAKLSPTRTWSFEVGAVRVHFPLGLCVWVSLVVTLLTTWWRLRHQ
jgi:hypothetical protein